MTETTDESTPVDTDCSTAGPWGIGRRNANANLIAAAPDLLEAVEAMLEEYEDGRNIQPFDIREMCRRAKFKAYGETYE